MPVPPPSCSHVAHLPSIYPAIDPAAAFANKTYAGKTVLITGASRGIGQTTALFFAKAGANVVLTARSGLDETVALIKQSAPDVKISTFTADVRDTDRAEEIVTQVIAQYGQLDILVANAGAVNPMGTRVLLALC